MKEEKAPVDQGFTEAEIISRILKGEKFLFELLMRRTNGLLYKVARSYSFSHEDAEDLMQEAHIAAYTHLVKFEGRSTYKTWLTRIMLNKCIYKLSKMEYRKRPGSIDQLNENEIPDLGNSHNYDTEKQVINTELSNTLERVIEQIPVDYRTVFILREKEGLNVSETAEVLDISEANVKVRLNRAKTMLRQKFEQYYSNAQVYEFNLIYCDKIVRNVFMALESIKG